MKQVKDLETAVKFVQTHAATSRFRMLQRCPNLREMFLTGTMSLYRPSNEIYATFYRSIFAFMTDYLAGGLGGSKPKQDWTLFAKSSFRNTTAFRILCEQIVVSIKGHGHPVSLHFEIPFFSLNLLSSHSHTHTSWRQHTSQEAWAARRPSLADPQCHPPQVQHPFNSIQWHQGSHHQDQPLKHWRLHLKRRGWISS